VQKPLLLDTQAFIHAVKDRNPFPKKARTQLESLDRSVFLSTASIWEMGIKIPLGKLDFGLPLESVVERALAELGLSLLSVTPRHIYRTMSLDAIHRDPFDRLIAAQALEEGMTIVSSDKIFDRYRVERVWN
jgi:PIN domain nuclease of toxin-antitoxin system